MNKIINFIDSAVLYAVLVLMCMVDSESKLPFVFLGICFFYLGIRFVIEFHKDEMEDFYE